MVGISRHITVYRSHVDFGSVSSRKVAFVLEELGLTYESIYLEFPKQEHRAPAFTKYNPNGRIPAIIDHANNGFVLWQA
jgi:glutathione S-transferase